jgi:alpha/beta superfamily hydrolase
MHNKVVFHAMKALNGLGFPVLRFNFRGTGRSEGVHDHARGEVEDVRAALDWLEGEFHLPMIFAGFSFGAATGLRAACPDAHVAGIIALGTPVEAEARAYSYKFLGECRKPKLFLSGDHDEFAPVAALKLVAAGAAEPKKLVLIPNADHFFKGRLELMQKAIVEWVREAMAP